MDEAAMPIQTVSTVYRYCYPLNPAIATYDMSVLGALIQRRIGLRPVAIQVHYRNSQICIYFDQELTDSQRSALESMVSDPPTVYIVDVAWETDDEIMDRIEQKLGVRPVAIVRAGDRFVPVFDQPVDVSQLTEDDLRIRTKIVLRTVGLPPIQQRR